MYKAWQSSSQKMAQIVHRARFQDKTMSSHFFHSCSPSLVVLIQWTFSCQPLPKKSSSIPEMTNHARLKTILRNISKLMSPYVQLNSQYRKIIFCCPTSWNGHWASEVFLVKGNKDDKLFASSSLCVTAAFKLRQQLYT